MKKLHVWILAVALIAVIAVGGTAAYFSGKDEVVNVFKIGEIDIELKEPNWKETDGQDLTAGATLIKDPTVIATKGQSYMRIRVKIVDGAGNLITDGARLNMILDTLYYDKSYVYTGKSDVTAVTELVKGEIYGESQLETLVLQGKIQKEYNHDDFTFAGIVAGQPAVRYYNYNGIFDAESLPPDIATLFTNVVVPIEWTSANMAFLNGDTYVEGVGGSVQIIAKGIGCKILISAEVIQSANITDAETAFMLLDQETGVTRDTSGL